MAPGMRVVVGLGNPGRRYVQTRHNIGFRLLDRLARDLGAGAETEAESYRVAWADLGGERVALVRPLTYMNRVGNALRRFHGPEAADPAAHLIILDDVALPFGAVRFRGKGRAGGHRGLESVLEFLGTEDVPRLRLGVSRGDEDRDLADYVLEAFTEEEEKVLGAWLEEASQAVRLALTEGLEAAMNRFNR